MLSESPLPVSWEHNSRSGDRETALNPARQPVVAVFFLPRLLLGVCHVVDVGVHSLPPASRLRPQFLPVAHCVAACSDYLHRQRASEMLPSKTLITPDALLSSANHATPECSDRTGRIPGDD